MYSIFCTGSSGLVASDLKHLANDKGISFFGLDLHGEETATDITKRDSLYSSVVTGCEADLLLRSGKQPILFHFAAITLTGENLTQEQIELTNTVNVEATQNVIDVCKQLDIPLVHISTDFVFAGGAKDTPYQPEDETCPDNSVYSRSKAEAERRVYDARGQQHTTVIRLAFPYGNFTHPKPCLARKMISWMDQKPEVNLYNDQRICPTPIGYFSQCCLRVCELINDGTLKSGSILHCVGEETTPYEFGTLVKKVYNKTANLIPTPVTNGTKNLSLDTSGTMSLLQIKRNTHLDYLKELV